MKSKIFGRIIISLLIFASVPILAQSSRQEKALQWYKQARQFEARQEYAKALELLRKAYEVTPNMYVTYHLGLVLFKLGDCEGATTYLSKLPMEKLPQNVRKNVNLMTLECRIKRLSSTDTLDALNALAVLYPLAPTQRLKEKITEALQKKVKEDWIIGKVSGLAVSRRLNELDRIWRNVGIALGSDTSRLFKVQVYERTAKELVKKGDIGAAAYILKEIGQWDAGVSTFTDNDLNTVFGWGLYLAEQKGDFDVIDTMIKQKAVSPCELKKEIDNAQVRLHLEQQCLKTKAGTKPAKALSQKKHSKLPKGSFKISEKVKHKPSYRVWAYITLGVGLAAGGAGLYLLLDSNKKFKDLENTWQEYYQEELIAKVNHAHNERTWGWVATGIGAASLITSTVLFIVEPKTSVRVTSFYDGRNSGISVFLDF